MNSKAGWPVSPDLPKFLAPWRITALPVVFVLTASEMLRNWGTPLRWLHLGVALTMAAFWVGALAGRAWVRRNAANAIDACIAVFVLSAVGLYLDGQQALARTIAGWLTFWSPLAAVWWVLNYRQRPLRLYASLVGLYLILALFDAVARPHLHEYAILGAALAVLVGVAVRGAPQGGQSAEADNVELRMYDPLTGVASAEYFEAELAHICAISNRYRVPYSLIACDIGNEAEPLGDETIRRVAWLIFDRVRSSDTVCRWQERRFLVLLAHTGLAECEEVADSIRDAVERDRPASGAAPFVRIGFAQHRFGDDPMVTVDLAEADMGRKAMLPQPAAAAS